MVERASVVRVDDFPLPEVGESCRSCEGDGGGVIELASILRVVPSPECLRAHRADGRTPESTASERRKCDHSQVGEPGSAPRIAAPGADQLVADEGAEDEPVIEFDERFVEIVFGALSLAGLGS